MPPIELERLETLEVQLDGTTACAAYCEALDYDLEVSRHTEVNI